MQKNSKLNNIVKKIKNNIPGFIAGVSLCTLVGVSAATYFPSINTSYDNKVSGLKSTNVQDAIDELYNSCKTPAEGGQGILDKTPIVTTGDGLYEDEYEDGRYIFKGANPNNYVTFNNEQAGWRVVSIEPDKTIKIMRNESIEKMVWDSSGSNNWARPASLNTYLNGTYYNGLNITAKSQIVSKNWSIGAITYNESNMVNTINNENGAKWNGKVALVTVSEYVRSNSNKSSCGTVQQLWNATSGQCRETTWMYYSDNWWWALSPFSGYSGGVFLFSASNGNVSGSEYGTNFSYGVRPALYLSSEVKITGGNGSQNTPYIIN